MWNIGLSDGAIADHDNLWIGRYSNSYAFRDVYSCWLAGQEHQFKLPLGVIQPSRKRGINVFGCGLVLDPENKLWIFFTVNGQLRGELGVLRVNKKIIYFQFLQQP
jgi:hypothetical protein